MRRPDRRRGGHEHVRPRGCPSDTFFPRAPGLPRRRGRAHLPRAAPRDPDADPPHGWMVLSLRPIARRVGGDARARGSVERRGRFLKRAGQRARAQRARDPQQRPAVQAVGEEEQPPARRRGSTQGQQGNEQEEPRLQPQGYLLEQQGARRGGGGQDGEVRARQEKAGAHHGGEGVGPGAHRRRPHGEDGATHRVRQRRGGVQGAVQHAGAKHRLGSYSTSTSACTR